MFVHMYGAADFRRMCAIEDPRELLEQLKRDIPRQRTVVDGIECTDVPCLLARLGGDGHPLLPYCTQAALAATLSLLVGLYTSGSVHVLDSFGRGTYAVDTADSALSVRKAFAVTDVDTQTQLKHITCVTDISAVSGAMVSWYVEPVPEARWLA